ncbi:uncharacterized protein Dana_GF15431 [Drosophila ananassae]|uniref:Uncharacterized protein n=1 Tax=Drosophila ananassae TaxID=7217 RepID=B3MKQ7_DROAN|nr:uncharacterized protein Dana_GF15431 [Drosophila ananassae]
MSAYNRRPPLQKVRSFDAELDVSGYTSFRAQHNSTAETPFLLGESEAENENCRNASNTAFLASRGMSTPGGPSRTTLQDQPKPKNRFYGGMEHLDIVARLSQTQPALECILRHVSAHTLDVMTQVSQAWKDAVYRSQRAVERLQNHRIKLNLSKENPLVPKRRRHLARANTTTVPLQISNHGNQSNSASLLDSGYSSIHLLASDTGRVLREQKQRVKCPRCGRGSRVFVSEAAREESALSQTLPLRNASITSDERLPLTRFLSLDLGEINSPLQQPAYNFAECTSLVCQFRFCINCLCKSHPGERCLVTELDTPSKLMMPKERLTPPQRSQNRDPKMRRKNSLKRLCF